MRTNLAKISVRISCALLMTCLLLSGCARTPEDALRAARNAFSREDYQEAIAEFTKTIQLAEPDSLVALMGYEGRAMAYMMEYEYGPSLRDFDEAIRISKVIAPEFEGAFDFSYIQGLRETAHKGKSLEDQYGIRLKDRLGTN